MSLLAETMATSTNTDSRAKINADKVSYHFTLRMVE
jgi:hypothetical protein